MPVQGRGTGAAVALIVLLLVEPGGAKAEHGSRADVAVVLSLYEDFASEAVIEEPESPRLLLEQLPPVLSRFFTARLSSLVRKDRDCVARTHEICKLDFSPIWASQDPTGAAVKITGAPQVGKVNVAVRYANGDRKDLQFDVQSTRAGWRIANISCATDGWSLIKLLEGGE